jgi:serine O-acetyltransferase
MSAWGCAGYAIVDSEEIPMSVTTSRLASAAFEKVDPIWAAVRADAEEIVRDEPALASFVFATVLNQSRLEDAIVDRISQRLDNHVVSAEVIRRGFEEALEEDASLGAVIRSDIAAVYDRDPACRRYIEPVLYFKGFHAIQTHRLAHFMFGKGRKDFAYYLQSRSSEVFQTDINPAVPMGRSIFLDHATGLVVGETAVIEDEVSILQSVTLGGTGKEDGDRHPKVRHGVLVGAGAKILGSIEVGRCSRIAAGSVVLRSVPPNTTVAGVPARVVGKAGCSEPAVTMDQRLVDDDAD